MALGLLTFNIGNPSAERAQRQLRWLTTRDEHLLILTETKASAGCRLLAGEFTAAGYAVHYPEPGPGEYGVMIVSRIPTEPAGIADRIGYLPTRAAGVLIRTSAGPMQVLGAYVPSRDGSQRKIDRKRTWLAAFTAALSTSGPVVLLGDLNILEPDHRPRYPFFARFEYDFYRSLTDRHGLVDAYRLLHPHAEEYSWVGRTGDGYRYDHAFCSRALAAGVVSAEYVHRPRRERLSDHSALAVRFDLDTADPLPVRDLASAVSLA